MPNPNLCDTADLTLGSYNIANDKCTKNVKILRIAFARRKWIDLPSSPVDDNCIEDIVMAGPDLFFEITGFDADLVTFTSTLGDDGTRTNTLTIDYAVLDKFLLNLQCNMENFCDWTIWIYTNECKQYLLGVENIGGELGSSYRAEVTGGTISFGGTANTTNTHDFTWKSSCSIHETDVDYESLPLAPAA